MPATTYSAIIVMILAAVLPRFGVAFSNDTLTTAVETFVQIVLGLFVYFTHKNVVAKARRAGAHV